MTPTLTALVEALRLLLREVEASGNAEARDFGWQKAVAASRAALSAFEAEPQGWRIETIRDAIAEALFLYNQAEDERRRGKKAWGKEHAEWRADAVCLELQRLGLLPLPLPPEING